MSYSPPAADLSSKPSHFHSTDRVVHRTLPLPLASTNTHKRVTLSLRRPAPSSIEPANSHQPQQPNLLPTLPTLPTLETSIAAPASPAAALSEPHTAPPNTLSPNTCRRSSGMNSLSDSDSIRSFAQPSRSPSLKSTPPSSINTAISSNMPGRITVVQPTINTTLYLKQRIPLHKNGLPIRSAMKAPQPTAVSGVRQARPMNSPLTSPKYVHFNTELEHVRLFLQGETPSCVAGRDTIIDRTDETGSTCDTTIALLNWAAISSASSFQPGDINAGALPLQVENVVLSEDKSELRGTILIHNIAFHKQVFVRYTVDFWRTQTDIPAEFVESITGSAVDRFGFKVPLNMDKTIVEKTFCFAVQYQVVGREFWDSNNGMNYQVECKRVVVTPAATLPTSNSLVGGTKSELSKQMNNILLSSNIPEYTKPIVLKKKKDLGGRYDLSNSLSATYHQTATNGGSYSRDLSSMSPSTGQTAYRPNEYAIPVQSPPGFHRSLYASSPKFVSSYMAMATAAASPPEHFHVDFDQLSMEHSFSKRASRQSWNGHGQETEPMCPPGRPRPVSFPSAVSSSLNNNSPLLRSGSPMSATSAPILIPSGSPIKGSQSSSSYYDFVDRYCFYESSPHSSPYSSPYSSYPNSPPAPCIRG